MGELDNMIEMIEEDLEQYRKLSEYSNHTPVEHKIHRMLLTLAKEVQALKGAGSSPPNNKDFQ